MAIAHRRVLDLGPLAGLAVYLMTPGPSPLIAAATAFVTLVATLLILPCRLPFWGTDVAILGVAFFTYGATLAPGMLPHDSGEFQLVAPSLGIAHPPGYALYTLIGKLFSFIPLHTPAWRLNLLSAVLAAGTLVFVYRAAHELVHSRRAALTGVVALAGSMTFWATATTASIRTLTAFLTALAIWLALRYSRTRSPASLLAVAFVLGLAVTHHGSLGLVALPVGLYLVSKDPRLVARGRLLLRAGLAFLAALLVVLYFPLRSAAGQAPLDPGGLTTVDGLLAHVLARGFWGDVLYFSDRQDVFDRVDVLTNILTLQFGWPLLTLAAIGLVPIVRPRVGACSRLDLVLLVLSSGLIAGAAITYRAAQTVEYLMPTYITLAILMCVGSYALMSIAPSTRWQALLAAAILLVGATNIARIAPSFVALSRQDSTRAVAEPVLREAPPGSTILADWHWATAYWYLQTVEGQRSDVTVQYVAPDESTGYEPTWRRRLADAARRGPVIVTNRYRSDAELPLTLMPFHEAFIATTAPASAPAEATPMAVDFDSVLGLRAFYLSASEVSPSVPLVARLWWQPLADGEARDYAVFLHLVGADGVPLAQDDVTYSATMLRRGGFIEQRSRLNVPEVALPDQYTLLAGVYFRAEDGQLRRLSTADDRTTVTLARVTVLPTRDPPATRHDMYERFAGGPTLRSVDFDTSREASTSVRARWQMPGSGGPWTAVLVADGQAVATSTLTPAPADSVLTTVLDVPDRSAPLAIEVLDADGANLPVQGAWYLPPRDPAVALPVVKDRDRYIVFGGEMALTGVQTNWNGDDLIVDLTWLSLRPQSHDYTVSVQLYGDGWRAQTDSVPGLGAIPSTKWIRGTVIPDRHRIRVPQGTTGPIDVQVTVYDTFRQTPLAVLDERFQRAGQGLAPLVERMP